MPLVVITDIVWPDFDAERAVLEAAGFEVRLAPPGDEDVLVDAVADADAILTCFRPVTARVLDAASHCRTVGRYGVGVDNIDVARATELGMLVSNVPEYCSEEVADHTILLLLSLARCFVPLAVGVREGQWNPAPAGGAVRLRGRTIGLIGFGHTAQAVVPRAQALGLEVLVHGTSRDPSATHPGVRLVADLHSLLAASDYVSLHLPLTDATRCIIDEAALASMRPTGVLINTSRGGLVDTEALTRALQQGRIGGAGLDVTDPEPLPAEHPLRTMHSVVITPHVAFRSDGSLTQLARTAAENVLEVLQGRTPEHVVNPAVLRGARR